MYYKISAPSRYINRVDSQVKIQARDERSCANINKLVPVDTELNEMIKELFLGSHLVSRPDDKYDVKLWINKGGVLKTGLLQVAQDNKLVIKELKIDIITVNFY